MKKKIKLSFSLNSLKKIKRKDFFLKIFLPLQKIILHFLRRIDLDKIFNQVFSLHSRPHIHQIFVASLSLFSTYMLGKIVATLLWPTPPPPSSSSSPTTTPLSVMNQLNFLEKEIDIIANSNLFRSIKKEKKEPSPPNCKKNPRAAGCTPPPPPTNLACETAKQKSALPITLLTAIVLQDEVKSVASVQVRNQKKLLNLRKGEEIPNLAEITKIHSEKLILKNKRTGQCEFVNINKKKTKTSSLNKIRIERDPVKGKKLIRQSKDSGIEMRGGQ